MKELIDGWSILDYINEEIDIEVDKENAQHVSTIAIPIFNSIKKDIEQLHEDDLESVISLDDLFHDAYISICLLIMKSGKGAIDYGEIKDRTLSFLTSIMAIEEEEKEMLFLDECPEEDCLGKECPRKYCYAFTGDTSLKNIKKAQENHVKVKRPNQKILYLNEKTR